MTNNQIITIISGSPRANSNTQKVVNSYAQYIKNESITHHIINLTELPAECLFNNQVMGNGNVLLDKIVNEKIIPATHLVFISPEYNGSYAGIVKTFIDGVKPEHFKAKKVGLVGVATGRAGNLRGMDHLQATLHYLGAYVKPINLPISVVHTLTNEDEIQDQFTLNALQQHLHKLINY